jgi:transposase-like protein
MSKNKAQFQTGYSLIELFKNYGIENHCADALFKWRWLVGFGCPQCGSGRHSVVKIRKLYQCTDCRHQTSLISGTILSKPSSRWPSGSWRSI